MPFIANSKKRRMIPNKNEAIKEIDCFGNNVMVFHIKIIKQIEHP